MQINSVLASKSARNLRLDDAENMLENIARKEEVRNKNEEECLRDLSDSVFESAKSKKYLLKFHKKIATLVTKTENFRA